MYGGWLFCWNLMLTTYYDCKVSGSLFSLLNFKFKMEDKSRSRVMYDTWFLLCGHFERVTATMGVWNNDTTYKPYWRKRNSWFFCKDGVLLFPLSTVYDFRQHTSSKEINVSPSCNLFSENSENQATFRDSDRFSIWAATKSWRRSGDTSPKGEPSSCSSKQRRVITINSRTI